MLSETILHSNIYRYLEDNLEENIKETHLYNLFFQVVSKSFQISQKLYPDSDFIIINYSYKPLPKNNELKKLGIKIIDIKDITSENLMSEKYYVSNEDHHPNKKAWQLIAQYLIKNKYLSQEQKN